MCNIRAAIYKTEDELVLQCEMPGIPPDLIKIIFEPTSGNVLFITVKGMDENTFKKERGYLINEKIDGDAYRIFPLNIEGFDVDRLVSSCEYGLVEIKIPKKKSS